MELKKNIETFGDITKVEKLHTLTSNVLENTFVLESFEPFPGYHGANLPSGYDPHHIFLVTKKEYSYEVISRISMKIRKNSELSFGARPAELFIFNKKYPAIRIKELKSFELVPELQNWYQDEGVFFIKNKTFNSNALIRVMKHFKLDEIEEGIYKDLGDPLMSYLQVPDRLTWKLFEKMTYYIKNNVENNNYDAAQGVVYLKDVMDVIRIYMKDFNLDLLKQLRAMYLEEFRKLHL
jgi:hypothetical protein